MEHHHELVGLAFAIMGTILVSSMSQLVFLTDQIVENSSDFSLDLKSDKVYLCSVFSVVLGLIQIVTSAYLTVNERFLKIWSIIHIVLAQCYIIMFIILIVKLEDETSLDEGFRANRGRNRLRNFDWLLCQGFLIITPVAVFNLIFKRGASSGVTPQPDQQLPGAWPPQEQQINYGWDYQNQPAAGPFLPPAPVDYAPDFQSPPGAEPSLPPIPVPPLPAVQTV